MCALVTGVQTCALPILPAMFRAFEPDDSVDPPCQETPGFSLSLTLIIQKDEERRSVYAGQNDAFAVVIEIEIGRASCRERGCPYVSITVVAVSFKNKCSAHNASDDNNVTDK